MVKYDCQPWTTISCLINLKWHLRFRPSSFCVLKFFLPLAKWLSYMCRATKNITDKCKYSHRIKPSATGPHHSSTKLRQVKLPISQATTY